jgi:hypothetical protein
VSPEARQLTIHFQPERRIFTERRRWRRLSNILWRYIAFALVVALYFVVTHH